MYFILRYIIYIFIYIYMYLILIYIYHIYVYMYQLCIPLFKMSHIKIKRKDIHKISIIFRLFTNLLRTNLNKKCKSIYVIRTVTR